MSVDLTKIVEDRDVVAPFIERTLLRLREKHPGVTMDDVTVLIEVRVPGSPTLGECESAVVRLRRMLRDMDKEGVVL